MLITFKIHFKKPTNQIASGMIQMKIYFLDFIRERTRARDMVLV